MRASYEHSRDFLRYPGDMRAALDARFARAVAAAGPAPPRDPSWPALRLPPSLRESLVAAAQRDACPDAVVAHYCERMPALLVEQLRPDDAPRALLHRPLVLARLPRLAAALDGLFAALAAAGVDAHALVARGVARRPRRRAPDRRRALRAHALRQRLAAPRRVCRRSRRARRRARQTRDADDVLDLRLSSHLVHELCHGPSRECDGPPGAVARRRRAATHLGAAARAQHLFPDEPGEALRGVSLFVLVGDVLARRLVARRCGASRSARRRPSSSARAPLARSIARRGTIGARARRRRSPAMRSARWPGSADRRRAATTTPPRSPTRGRGARCRGGRTRRPTTIARSCRAPSRRCSRSTRWRRRSRRCRASARRSSSTSRSACCAPSRAPTASSPSRPRGCFRRRSPARWPSAAPLAYTSPARRERGAAPSPPRSSSCAKIARRLGAPWSWSWASSR